MKQERSRGTQRTPLFGVRTLFGVGRRELLARGWPDRPQVHDGDPARLGLLAIPELGGVHRLLQERRLRDEPVIAVGRAAAESVSPREGLRRYEAGEPLYLARIDLTVPRLRELGGQLAADLGFAPDEVVCEGFAALRGRRLALHYDHDLNFSVQLRGEKRWRYARNRTIENPLASQYAFEARRVRAVLAGAPTRRVGPGGVLYLPRGYWHETRTVDESFSVTFAVRPRTLAQRVASEVERRLHELPEGRAYPVPTPAGGPADAAAWQGAIAGLHAIAASLDPRRVLAGPAAGPWYRFTGSVRLETAPGGGTTLLVEREEDVLELEVERPLVPLVRRLARSKGEFSRAHADQAGAEPAEVRALLGYLERIGVLERAC